MAERNLLNDVLRRIVQAAGLRRDEAGPAPDLIAACRALLAERSESAALVAASGIVARLAALPMAERLAFWETVAQGFGADDARLQSAIADWQPGDPARTRALHFAAEPAAQALIRRLNMAPGATARLVAMRGEMLAAGGSAALRSLDADFLHLFSSWFNRGFLELRRIDWSSPAAVLEKIISYEAVHEIRDWSDLRARVGDADRRLFAFFHPAMPGEPLVFVEVALTAHVPGRIADILSPGRPRIDPAQADTAVFYSISNCHDGLRGISFGNFLIKQVAIELGREFPGLGRFVTLSPVPGLRRWAEGPDLPEGLRPLLPAPGDGPADPARLAAHYLLTAQRASCAALDPVAHFHLGNGAQLLDIHADADASPAGQAASWGVMVNYLYDEAQVDARHRAYAADRSIAAAPKVAALLTQPRRRSRPDA